MNMSEDTAKEILEPMLKKIGWRMKNETLDN